MRRLSILTMTLAVAFAAATACGSDSGSPTTAASPYPAAPDSVEVCAAATEEALLAALRSSPVFFGRAARPTGFWRIQCKAPFALGSTAGTVQSSGVLFRRDDSQWTVLAVGSALRCAKYGVTADTAMEGCTAT